MAFKLSGYTYQEWQDTDMRWWHSMAIRMEQYHLGRRAKREIDTAGDGPDLYSDALASAKAAGKKFS